MSASAEAVWASLDPEMTTEELAFRVNVLMRFESLEPENYHTRGLVASLREGASWSSALKMNRYTNTMPDPRAR